MHYSSQIRAGQETEQIRKEGEAIRRKGIETSVTNHLLKEPDLETLTEDKGKAVIRNEKVWRNSRKSYRQK